MKFKVITQSAREDCGSACVCMVLNNYFERNVSLCEIRPIIKNTLNGTSFGDMKNGLKRFGVNTTIYKTVKEPQVFSEISLPVITQIHKDDNTWHYILIFKCSSRYILCRSRMSNYKKNKNSKIYIKLGSLYHTGRYVGFGGEARCG